MDSRGGLAKPDKVASPFAFFSSDGAGAIAGAIHVIEGGSVPRL